MLAGFAWRALPVFLFIMSGILLFWQYSDALQWTRVLWFATAIAALWFFFQPYTTRFYIDRTCVTWSRQTGFTMQVVSLSLSAQDCIIFKQVRGRTRMAWWVLHESKGKVTKMFFLNEPVFSSIAGDLKNLKQTIEQVSGIRVVGPGRHG